MHFSGHGTQKVEDVRAFEHKGTGELALAVLDSTVIGIRYLRSRELAAFLRWRANNFS